MTRFSVIIVLWERTDFSKMLFGTFFRKESQVTTTGCFVFTVRPGIENMEKKDNDDVER